MTPNRRSILQGLAVAPIAGPIVAKEAAAKMGLSSVLSGAGMLGGMPFGGESIGSASNSSFHARMVKDLADIVRGEPPRDVLDQARQMATRLDADLAAFRSMSPSAAYQVQCARALKALMENRKSELMRMLEPSNG